MKLDYQLNGYTLHLIPVKHLKTLTISYKLLAPLNRETVTQRTFLSYLLTSSTRKYNSSLKLTRYLENLYGCSLTSGVSSKGKGHVISINATILNNNYVKEDLLLETIELINDCLFDPDVINNEWSKEIYDIKKNELTQRYISINDDKMSYSLNQLFNYMGRGTALGIETIGYLDDLEHISRNDIYHTLNDALDNDIKHIYILGDIDETIVDVFKKNLSFKNHTNTFDAAYTYKSSKKEVLEIIERQNIVQSKLNIGYTLDGNFNTEKHYIYTLLFTILGGYSNSKLFLNVREKNSLCYYISSSYDALNGFAYITAGIDQSKYKDVVKLIDIQISNIQSGQVTDDELNLAKNVIINSLKKSYDEPNRTIGLYYNRDINNKDESIEEYIDKLNNVTLKDIIEASNDIKKDTIYFLTGVNENGSY